MDHDFPFTGAKRIETRPKYTQGTLSLPTGPIAREASFDSFEEVLISEGFGEKLYGAPLHRLHAHRDVGVRRHKDDWELSIRRD